jgi:hypothetical protein
MPVLSRTRLAAVCAALSTAVVAGMAALTVLAGDRSCDLSGCPPVATFAVSTAVHAAEVERTCAAPSTTPSTPPGAAAALRIAVDPCEPARAGGDRRGTGGIATARVPAP